MRRSLTSTVRDPDRRNRLVDRDIDGVEWDDMPGVDASNKQRVKNQASKDRKALRNNRELQMLLDELRRQRRRNR